MRQRLLIQSLLTLSLCLSLNVATTAQDKRSPENEPPKQDWGWLTKHLSDIRGSSLPRPEHRLTPGEELAQAHAQMKEMRRELDAARAEFEAKEQNKALLANLEAEVEKHKKAGMDERERADTLARELEVSRNERLALQRELDMAQEQKLGIQQEQQRATKLAAKLALDLAAARIRISPSMVQEPARGLTGLASDRVTCVQHCSFRPQLGSISTNDQELVPRESPSNPF